MSKKKPSGKRVSVKAWGAFVRGNAVPDETFPGDWSRSHVRKFMAETKAWEPKDIVVHPITISYLIPGASRVQK